MDTLQFLCPCHFGLESVLTFELQQIGAENIHAENGKVYFTGDFSTLARANICLRTAERVLILLAQFHATSFEELFQGVRAIPLEDFIGQKDAFPVKGKSLSSNLHSVPDCQKIVKKAAVERLKEHYGVSWFVETGPVHQLQFLILKNKVTIMLDTTGVGLHKRGYRAHSNEAPIKETLAAGIVDLAHVRSYSTVYDPFCGSGTFLIEAATKALNIPPCLRRKFAAQDWGLFPETVWREERARAVAGIKTDTEFHGFGSDIDPNAVELTLQNAKKAGVNGKLTIRQADIKDYRAAERRITICNPPYGERMLEKQDAQKIYRIMGRVFQPLDRASYYIISPDETFEKQFGRPADRRRKLYNGMMKCQVYQYYRKR